MWAPNVTLGSDSREGGGDAEAKSRQVLSAPAHALCGLLGLRLYLLLPPTSLDTEDKAFCVSA